MTAEELFRHACELDWQGKHSQAAATFKKLVAKAPEPRYYIAYGRCLQYLQHWEQAAVQLERGLALKPRHAEADARLMLAESYLQAGDKSKAVEQWRIVESLKPSYPSYDAPIAAAKARLQEHA